MKAIIKRARQMREAGRVMRCHTLPHVGSYTVAEHSWHAVSLLYTLKPDASRELMLAVLFHDTAERWLGDQPSTVARYHPDLRRLQYQAERQVLKNLGAYFDLTEDDWLWLEVVDKLELWCWCQDQLHGWSNRAVAPAIEYLNKWFEENPPSLPESVKRFLRDYEWGREHELPEGHQ